MILEVMGRKYRVTFKYDMVYAVKKHILSLQHFGRNNRGEAYFLSMRKTKKQSIEFIPKQPDPTISLTTIAYEGQDYMLVDSDGQKVIPRKRITAFVEDITDKDTSNIYPRVEGQAVCSPKDRYCKEKGRKIALAKAVQEVFSTLPVKIIPDGIDMMRKLDKELRSQFWFQYFNAKSKTKTVKENRRIPEEDKCPHSDGEDWPCPLRKEYPRTLEWCKDNCPIRYSTECVNRGLEMEIQRIQSLSPKEKSNEPSS